MRELPLQMCALAARNRAPKSDNANREIALVWRKNSPRADEFQLLAEELRTG